MNTTTANFKSIKKAVWNIVNEAMNASASTREIDPMNDLFETGIEINSHFNFLPYAGRIEVVLYQTGATKFDFGAWLRSNMNKGSYWNNDCNLLLETLTMEMGITL